MPQTETGDIRRALAPGTVKNPTAQYRPRRHAKAACHAGASHDGSRHLHREVSTDRHGIKRHDPGTDEAENGSDGIELSQLPGIKVSSAPKACTSNPATSTRLAQKRSPIRPNPIRPPTPAIPSTE